MLLYTSYISRLPSQVQAYQKRFGRAQVKVILLDELINSPHKAYRSLLNFLEVQSDFVPDLTSQNTNRAARSRLLSYFLRTTSSKIKRVRRTFSSNAGPTRLGCWIERFNKREIERPSMDPERPARLARQFAPVVDELSAVLQRDLAAWRA